MAKDYAVHYQKALVEIDRLTIVIDRLNFVLNRYRYAYRWWQADSYDVSGEMQARFNWAAGEDQGARELDSDDIAKIGHQFLLATSRDK